MILCLDYRTILPLFKYMSMKKTNKTFKKHKSYETQILRKGVSNYLKKI